MNNIQFKKGVIKSGEYEGYRCFLMINDDYLTLNISSKGKCPTMKYDNIEQMNKAIKIDWDDVDKERELASEVVEWWSKNFPKPDFYEKMLKILSEKDEPIDPYGLFGTTGAVQCYYDEKFEDKKELSLFLDAYAKFYDEFFEKYQHGQFNDLEEYATTELFEWLDENQSRLVFDLLQPGKLKDLCKKYFKF